MSEFVWRDINEKGTYVVPRRPAGTVETPEDPSMGTVGGIMISSARMSRESSARNLP